MDYWMVPQNLAQKIGIVPAVVLCMLISKETENIQQKKIKKGQAFTILDENFRKKFNISRRTFDNTVGLLEFHHLIFTKRFGLPCKKYYFINHEEYNKIATEMKNEE